MLGPLDKRRQCTRCEACARRRIKCERGTPCKYCIKMKKDCIPPPSKEAPSDVFVLFSSRAQKLEKGATRAPVSDNITLSLPHCTESKICPQIRQETSCIYISHFFSTFLARNDFASNSALDTNTIISRFHTSPSLYNAILAIGSLDISRKPFYSSLLTPKATRLEALTAYRQSILAMQTSILQKEILKSDASLWATFFLGLFELMFDVSGEGWVKHILYGTSKILKLRGPEAHALGSGRSFFLTVRVFEICRSLIYSEPSFLSQPNWRSLMQKMWEGEESMQWHPNEALFDLMISCSSLALRVWDAINPKQDATTTPIDDALPDLATEGVFIRETLNKWHSDFTNWSIQNRITTNDSQSILAMLYYNAISIYLSGIFDYRAQFNHLITPTLSVNVIQSHTRSIISISGAALKDTNLAGALFFFPLRVAGARAITREHRHELLNMLKEISARSFVVADAFHLDLESLWGENDIVNDANVSS